MDFCQGKGGTRKGVGDTDYKYRVSFGGDENGLKLIVGKLFDYLLRLGLAI